MMETFLVILIGAAAGVMNSIGGGGTFVALPALVALGVPPVTANALARIALVPGALAGVWVYRRELKPIGGLSVRLMTMVSVAGSVVGAALLLVLPASSFGAAAPWLLAFATVLLALGPGLGRLVTRMAGRPLAMPRPALLACQFVIAIYGGYFGGALGILLVAVWGIGLGIGTAEANPLRITQLAAVFSVSAVIFLFASDALRLGGMLLGLVVGATLGGYAGARVARRLPGWLLRAILLVTAVAMTVMYFVRG